MIPLGILASARHAPAGGGGGFAYLGSGSSTLDALATHTVTDLPFGAEAADRVIVAAISTRVANGRSLASVTIGGVAATIDKVTPTWPSAIIARAVVPTGTSGTVAITLSGSERGPQHVAVYGAYGTVAVAGSGAHYSGSTSTSTTDVAHAAGAWLIAAVGTSSHDVVLTWAGVTEDVRLTSFSNAPSTGGFASALPTDTGGPTTVKAVSTGALYQGLAAVAYTIT